MALSASKTWVAGEVLTASDLNGEFTNIYGGGQTIGFPRTAEADFNGQVLWLDAGKSSSFTADTDNKLDLALAGTDLYQWDGTGTTPVTGLKYVAGATGVATQIQGYSGTDTNVSIDLVPKGSGDVLINGSPIGSTVLRAVSSNVVARTTKLRVMHAEFNHIGEAQSLSF